MPQPLSRVQFKNWRSLRDVTIDFDTPITVFIGANASGKTNIIDGLRFLQSMTLNGILETVYAWKGYRNILTQGIDDDEDIELTWTCNLSAPPSAGYGVHFNFSGVDVSKFSLVETLFIDDIGVSHYMEQGPILREIMFKAGERFLEQSGSRQNKKKSQRMSSLLQFIQKTQFLSHDFFPAANMVLNTTNGFNRLALNGSNLSYVLDFMRQYRPQKFASLIQDARWLLSHIDHLDTERTEHEVRLLVHEKSHPNSTAATISGGTLRVIGMLTPFYMLDFYPMTESVTIPGLVVIEEPDTALNPGLLARFVEQLRLYTSGEKPRQIILTTHNPVFLEHFHADEIRVVQRDEAGDTSVERIPDDVRDLWLKSGEYGIGQAWMSNAFGGVPE
jgi:predicted ATPase